MGFIASGELYLLPHCLARAGVPSMARRRFDRGYHKMHGRYESMRVLGLVLLASVMMVSGCRNSTVEQIRVPAAP